VAFSVHHSFFCFKHQTQGFGSFPPRGYANFIEAGHDFGRGIQESGIDQERKPGSGKAVDGHEKNKTKLTGFNGSFQKQVILYKKL
jgi:hypothetical protein